MNFLMGFKNLISNAFSFLRYLLNRNPTSPYRKITELYPDPVSSRQSGDLPKNTKGLLYNEIEQCIGCSMCAKVCPVNCILVDSQRIEFLQKEWVSIFDIDHLKCIHCGLCTEHCPTGSLTVTGRFELSDPNPEKFVEKFGKGPIPDREVYDSWT